MPVNALTLASSGVLSMAWLICLSESRSIRAVIKAARSEPTERDNCSTCLLSRCSSPTQSPECTQYPSRHSTLFPRCCLTTSLHIPYSNRDALRNLVMKSNIFSQVIQSVCNNIFEVDANVFNTVTSFPVKLIVRFNAYICIVGNEILFFLTLFLRIS